MYTKIINKAEKNRAPEFLVLSFLKVPCCVAQWFLYIWTLTAYIYFTFLSELFLNEFLISKTLEK